MNVQQLDATFFALADPTRRAILARLAKGDATVGELTVPSGMSQPAVSRHLKVLERAGLVLRRRHAQQRPCHLEVKPLMAANAWIEQYRQMWEHMISNWMPCSPSRWQQPRQVRTKAHKEDMTDDCGSGGGGRHVEK